MPQIKRRGRKKKYSVGDIFIRKIYPKSMPELWLCIRITRSAITKKTYYEYELQNKESNPSAIKVWKLEKCNIDSLITNKQQIEYYYILPHEQNPADKEIKHVSHTP